MKRAMAGCGKCRSRSAAILNTSCTVAGAIILRRVKRHVADVRMIDERHNPEAIVKFAEALLSRQFDHEARLVGDCVFSGFKSIVVRCHVESSGADLPDALIVKKAREDRVGYLPDSQATPNAAHELFNDWAAANPRDAT